jgi:CHASE2 domain-containing sensor protein
MPSRERTAQGLVISGSLILFATAALHGFAGYPALSRALSGTNLRPFLGRGLRALWLLVAWHWVAVGIVASVVAFRGRSARRLVLLLCGLFAWVDAIGVFVAVGLFVGNEMLTLAGLAIMCGALLFPSGQGSQS